MQSVKERFLERTDETGRFIVYSSKTGITYYVEPTDVPTRDQKAPPKEKWGDLNPITGKNEGSYGEKYKGSIHPSESLITEENGFKNIENLGCGVSPHGSITEIDDIRYAEGFRPKQ